MVVVIVVIVVLVVLMVTVVIVMVVVVVVVMVVAQTRCNTRESVLPSARMQLIVAARRLGTSSGRLRHPTPALMTGARSVYLCTDHKTTTKSHAQAVIKLRSAL